MIRAQTAHVKPNREKKQNRNILREAPGFSKGVNVFETLARGPAAGLVPSGANVL